MTFICRYLFYLFLHSLLSEHHTSITIIHIARLLPTTYYLLPTTSTYFATYYNIIMTSYYLRLLYYTLHYLHLPTLLTLLTTALITTIHHVLPDLPPNTPITIIHHTQPTTPPTALPTDLPTTPPTDLPTTYAYTAIVLTLLLRWSYSDKILFLSMCFITRIHV